MSCMLTKRMKPKMSCRHVLANGTCIRCYPTNPFGREDKERINPGPEENYEPNLDGPGAVTIAIARTVVMVTRDEYAIAAVQENIAGYSIDQTRKISTWAEGRAAAQATNEAIGVSQEEAWRIVQSSMAASRAAGLRWGPR